jgi:hypothetical protein
MALIADISVPARLILFRNLMRKLPGTEVSDKHTWMSILVLSPEDGGSMFLRNDDIYLQVHAAYNPPLDRVLS